MGSCHFLSDSKSFEAGLTDPWPENARLPQWRNWLGCKHWVCKPEITLRKINELKTTKWGRSEMSEPPKCFCISGAPPALCTLSNGQEVCIDFLLLGGHQEDPAAADDRGSLAPYSSLQVATCSHHFPHQPPHILFISSWSSSCSWGCALPTWSILTAQQGFLPAALNKTAMASTESLSSGGEQVLWQVFVVLGEEASWAGLV